MIRDSFVLRVLSVLFVFIALPLLIACFILFQKDYERAINDAKLVLETTAKLKTHSLYHIRPFSSSFVGELAYYLNLADNMPKDLDPKMSDKLREISQLSDNIHLYLVIPEKKFGHYKKVAEGESIYTEKDFVSYDHLPSISKGGEINFVRTIYSADENKYIFNLYTAKAILSKENQSLLGYLLVVSNIDNEVRETLNVENDGGERYRFAAVQEDGVVVAADDKKLIGNYFYPMSSQKKEKFLLETYQNAEDARLASQPLPVNVESQQNFFEFQFGNQVQLAYLPSSAEFGVAILAYSEKEKVFHKAMRRFLFIYNAYGLLLIVGGGVSYALSQLLSRPLKQLSNLMKDVGEGNLSVRFHAERFGYEINSLGNIFNQTLDTLLTNIEKAENYRVAKETYQKELEIGYEVQRQLLPEKMPTLSQVELVARYFFSAVAAGDFYDILVRNDKHLFLVVGDVATKGITPCLYALVVRSLIRSYSYITEDIGKILTATNTLFCKDSSDTGIYVTLLMAHYDLQMKMLSYYSCGHVPAIVRRANGHLEFLTHRGMALGLKEGIQYEQVNCQMEPGDLILFYTDGLTRSLNEMGQPFSFERLCDILQHRNWVSAAEVIQGIEDEMRAFLGERLKEEEMVFFAMRII